MKVIDLLVDKVNGKQLPNKIKANGIMFILDKDINEYKRKDGNAEEFYTDYMIDGFVDLTDEVEIIEEDKKIEHIENYFDFTNLNDSEKFDYLYEMETRIIDYINKEKE